MTEVTNDEAENIEQVAPEEVQESVEPAPTTESDTEAPKPNRRAERRIKQLTERAGTAETENERLKAENQDFQSRLTSLEERQEEIAPSNPKPDREDYYGDDDEYMEAMVDWKMSEKERMAEMPQVTEKTESYQENPSNSEAPQEVQELLQAGLEKYPDFEILVRNPAVPMNHDIMESMLDSDHGADIAYHLAKNPLEAHRIAALSPEEIHGEIAKIGAGFKPAESRPDAPEPIATMSGGDNSGAVDVSKMTTDQYIAMRRRRK